MAPPMPLRTDIAAPWWQALAAGEVALQKCGACARPVHYPRGFCPHCGTRDPGWVKVLGHGTLHTFTVTRAPLSPDFRELPPQMLCVVDLDAWDGETVRVVSTLVGIEEADIRIGMRVAPVFDGATFEGLAVLRFTAG